MEVLQMELCIFQKNNEEKVVLLDDKMRVVKPVKDYLKYVKLKDKSLNTIRAYARDLKIYWQFLQLRGYEYDKVTPNTIGEFIEYLREPSHDDVIYVNTASKRTGKTVNRILSTVYNFYKYCSLVLQISNPIIKEEVNRPFNMFKGLLEHIRNDNKTNRSIFKVKEVKKSIHIISNEEAIIFHNSLPTLRDKLLFKIMYLSGMRIGEVLSLCIEDIPIPDSTKDVAVVNIMPRESNKYYQQTKSGSRSVYMPMSLLEDIDNFIIQDRNNIETNHSYIFVSYQKRFYGKPLTYRGVYEVFNRVSKKTGIKFTFHDLRHTCITTLVESGMDISVAKIIAGHKYISTTQKYIHLSNKYLEASMKKYWSESSLIGGAFNGK